MSEQLIDLLKLGLLALLYLFFLRVIWAVWTELRAPAVEAVGADAPSRSARKPRTPRAKPARGELTALRILEPAESAGTTHQLQPEMTMGRAPGCTVVVDDTYVSQLHARVFSQEGAWHVEDLGSTNGTSVDGKDVDPGQPVELMDLAVICFVFFLLGPGVWSLDAAVFGY